MIKQAECKGGVVYCDGKAIDDIEPITTGQGDSTGYILADKNQAVYIPIQTSNVEETLEKLTSTIDELIGLVNELAISISTVLVVQGSPLDTAFQGKATTINTNLEAIKTEITELEGGLK